MTLGFIQTTYSHSDSRWAGGEDMEALQKFARELAALEFWHQPRRLRRLGRLKVVQPDGYGQDEIEDAADNARMVGAFLGHSLRQLFANALGPFGFSKAPS